MLCLMGWRNGLKLVPFRMGLAHLCVLLVFGFITGQEFSTVTNEFTTEDPGID